MFNETIDVADIMRKIRSEVLPDDNFDVQFDSNVSQELSNLTNDIKRIHEFIINTRNNIENHKNIGYNIPAYSRFPWIVRKPFHFISRIFSLAIRFITREQNIVNNDVSASIKAIVESEQQIFKALSIISNHSSKLEEINVVLSKKLDDQISECNEYKKKYLELYNKMIELDKAVNESNVDMDNSLYLRFEDEFRGNTDDISKRLTYYIDNFVRENITLDTDKAIIDIGCGRGEWLELLKQNGYNQPIGIDINESMVHYCTNRGLKVICSDAIEYLKTLEEKSVKLITAFQVIEHLNFKQINTFLEEISRVLDDNGIVILETPNPYNLEVGACNFYIDPTHIKPIHPSLLEFVAKEKGINTQIVHWKKDEVEKWWESVVASDETDVLSSPSFRTVTETIKNTLYNSSDYALIGSKK